jgi:hypothetical protein
VRSLTRRAYLRTTPELPGVVIDAKGGGNSRLTERANASSTARRNSARSRRRPIEIETITAFSTSEPSLNVSTVSEKQADQKQESVH